MLDQKTFKFHHLGRSKSTKTLRSCSYSKIELDNSFYFYLFLTYYIIENIMEI